MARGVACGSTVGMRRGLRATLLAGTAFPTLALAASALLAIGLAEPAFGAGGAGGDGSNVFIPGAGGDGGTDSPTGAGGDGEDGAPHADGGGGGGGGGAGEAAGSAGVGAGGGGDGGGGGVHGFVDDTLPATDATGTDGGDGGIADFGADGGGGGGGGAGGWGAVVTGSGVSGTIGVIIQGGAGGAGGDGATGDGGSGGTGGVGLYFTQGGHDVTIEADISGGTGGAGGTSVSARAGFGSYGGHGVVLTSGGTVTIGADATVRGGNGGASSRPAGGGAGGTGILAANGGTIFVGPDATVRGGDGGASFGGVSGFGGSGIRGSNLAVIVAGTVAGGSGLSAGNAITFEDGASTLELQGDYTILGNVVASGTDDTLAFGLGEDAFDLGLIGDSAQYRGFDNFEVRDGVWRFSGATSESFAVEGGTLGGTGSFGGLDILAGGVHAPGNSIGRQVVNGDYTLRGVLEIEVAPAGLSDVVEVHGTVDIADATLRILRDAAAGSAWSETETYTIIDNQGADAVDGFFGTVDNRLAFFSHALDYSGGDGNDVVLTLTLIGDPGDPGSGGLFPRVALTPNQLAVARALDGLNLDDPAALEVFAALLGLSVEEARRAFDLSSGEVHASAVHLVGATHDLFTRAVRHQGRANLGAGVIDAAVLADYDLGFVSPGLASPMMPELVTPSLPQHSVWLAPLGGAGVVAADGNAAELAWWTGGVAAGADTRFGAGNGEVLVGAAFGYLASGGIIEDRLSRVAGAGYHAALYGSYRDGPLSSSGVVSYGATHVETSRDIVFGAIDRTAEADYWVHGLGVSTALAYAFALAEDDTSRTTLSPLATLDGHWAGHGGASETGADALDLTLASADHSRLDLGLGLELGHTAQLQDGASVTLTVRATYEREVTGSVPEQGMTLAGSPVDFVVRGAAASPDRVRLGVGLDYRADETLSVNARYEGLLAVDGSDFSTATHAGSIGVDVRF